MTEVEESVMHGWAGRPRIAQERVYGTTFCVHHFQVIIGSTFVNSSELRSQGSIY